MAAALLPFLPGLAGALLGSIPSIISLSHGGKGGRLQRHKKVARRGGKVKHHRVRKLHRGRGPVADVLGSIPLLGMALGPLAKAFGGRVKHRRHAKRGRGMYNPFVYRHYKGAGMLFAPGGQKPRRGGFLLPPAVWGAIRGATGMGLLAPAGGKVIHHRKGHYRHVAGKRVHVSPSLVGSGALVRHIVKHQVMPTHHRGHGGYIPYALKAR